MNQSEKVILSDERKEKLVSVFKNVNYTDYDERNRIWVEYIQNGFFDFTYKFEDAENAYSFGLILDDPSYCPAFFQAVQEHYDWVKESLNNVDLPWKRMGIPL